MFLTDENDNLCVDTFPSDVSAILETNLTISNRSEFWKLTLAKLTAFLRAYGSSHADSHQPGDELGEQTMATFAHTQDQITIDGFASEEERSEGYNHLQSLFQAKKYPFGPIRQFDVLSHFLYALFWKDNFPSNIEPPVRRSFKDLKGRGGDSMSGSKITILFRDLKKFNGIISPQIEF